MYKVMVVDDDFPVVELIAKAIDWESLGLQLIGKHENGLIAWENAQADMPDILITDIGMPLMDGLELIDRMKQAKPSLRVAILSCHSEFHYARQAMRLHVEDYLLKDIFNPEDLERLLYQFKNSLDYEKQTDQEQAQMRQLVEGTTGLRKGQWMKNFIQQPLLSPRQWLQEARQMGVLTEGEVCQPVVGFLDSYRKAKQQFHSDQTLLFAVNNVLEEAAQALDTRVLIYSYSVKETLLLFPYRPSLKLNPYDEIAKGLHYLQMALRSTLKLSMSFLMKDACLAPEQLKAGLSELLEAREQRFYLESGSIEKCRTIARHETGLFSFYEQASKEFRETLLGQQLDGAVSVVQRWIERIRHEAYAPETVRDWVLKQLLDLKLKMQSLQLLRPGFTADALGNELNQIDSLGELSDWLQTQLHSLIEVAGMGAGTNLRPEVVQACQYVSMNLNKKISLEEVAEHLYLNPSYFSRMFKKDTGEGFIEYVTRMKMERAKELLDQSPGPVGKISEQLGYDNQSYFIKIFKAYTGCTPAEYRG